MATKVASFNPEPLTNGAHFSFMEATIAKVEAHATAPTKLTAELANLKLAFAEEDACLKISRKSLLTEGVSTWDGRRDTFQRAYKTYVKAMRKLPEGELKEYAEQLWQNIVDYGIDPSAQLDKQTGELTNQLADLEGKLSEQVEALGLSFLRDKMKEANDKVRELMSERDAEKSVRKSGALKTARLATDDAYEALIEKLNAYALIEGAADYQELIDWMNETIRRYKLEALGESSKKDEEEEKPSEKPGTETPENPDGQGGEQTTPTEPDEGTEEPQPGVDNDGDGSPEVV